MAQRKADLDLIKVILQRNEIGVRQAAKIIEELKNELDNAIDEEKAPPVKKQFVIMVSDPQGLLKKKDLTGWVLQIPEEDSPYLCEERLVKSAYEFNQTQKGRRLPVQTIGETCEAVTQRIFKEQNIWVKTKEPVLVVRTENEVPWEKKDKR
jgi:hypothetical protein